MKHRVKTHAALFFVAFPLSILSVSAATVVIDFGNGTSSVNNSQNGGLGNWAPFADNSAAITTVSTTTLGGLTITLSGTAGQGSNVGDERWAINEQGIGIYTDASTSVSAASARIDSTETIFLSFSQDVDLLSARFGNFGTGETVTITPQSLSAISLLGGGSTGPNVDLSLGSVRVLANTPIAITMSGAGGVLFNEIKVDIVPEPTSALLLGVSGGFLMLRRRRHLLN